MPSIIKFKFDDINQVTTIMKSTNPSKSKKSASKIHLDSFNTISVIGKGSYAKVLLVKKKDTSKFFAMKIVKKQYIEKKKQESHIRTEREVLLKASDHPFIVRLHYTFQNEKNLYFVLDYCYGGELFNFLQKRGRLNEDEARFYASQLVLAIEHLHKHNIIYRDLKPENVLISDDGYIKIADFGLSKLGVSCEATKTFCGTPEYLAPEIVDEKGHGKPVDWWALGSIVYEMMVGLPPFYSQSKADLFDRIRHEDPIYPKYLSDRTKRFLQNLLHKDPMQRLGSTCGADEVKKHPWFYGFNFEAVWTKETKPFFVPEEDKMTGLTHFDQHFTDMTLYSPIIQMDSTPCKHYSDFTWNEDIHSTSYSKLKQSEQYTRFLDEEEELF